MSEPEYDSIANQYKDAKKQGWRSVIEEHTLFSLLPDLSNLRILDIACGDGIYTRKLKKLGAGDILGVDLSSKMVDLGNEEEERDPLGVCYEVGDAAKLNYEKEFDLIFASYLFNYARSQEELASYCSSIFRALKEGGQLIGMNDNPLNGTEDYQLYEKYGFTKSCAQTRIEGTPITYTIRNADGSSFSFDNYYLSTETYQKTFGQAGFVDFRWVSPYLSEEQRAADGAEYWDCFIDKPPVVALQAERP